MFAVIHEAASLHMHETTFCAENYILHELIFAIFTVTTNSQNLVPCKYFQLYSKVAVGEATEQMYKWVQSVA